MTTYLFHSSSYRAAISILLLLAPITAWGGVSFPKNPQTTAECEGPIEEMRAMANSEHELASQLKWPVAPEGCFYNSRCANAYHDEHAKIADEKGMHYKERDRIYKELSDLKQTCYAAARANEKLTDEAKQKERLAEEARLAEAKRAKEAMQTEARQNEKLDNEARQKEAASLLVSKHGRDVKEAYENVKEAKESDGTISGFLENELNKTKDQFVKEGIDNAYVKRNDAHSDSLENAMDMAKESILDPVPKSPIIGAIQDASFDRLKSHVQQLSGDMTALESAINSVDSGTSSASQEAAPVALPRRGSSSGSTMFQQAISQAEQDVKDPSARVARERRAAEQEKIESEQAAKAQEQSSQAAWNVLGKLGKAAIAAAGGQSSAEQMQLALNSLAQGEAGPDASGSAATGFSYAWDCNLLNGKWEMTSSAHPEARLIFSAKVSSGSYTFTRLEVKGIDGSNAVMTGSCSDFTRENQLSRDAMTIKLSFGDGTWKHTKLDSLSKTGKADEYAGSCQEAYDRQEAENTAINQRRNPNIRGVLPDLQVALYMTSQRMAMLDKLCKGQPQYAEYASMKLGYDRAMQACRQSVTNSTYCVPKVAW